MKKYSKINIFFALTTLVAIILIIVSPQTCISGAKRGLLMCADIIIPSLFPFTVCVLFIMRLNVLQKLSFVEQISQKIFRLPAKVFFSMVLSMLGGYPIGARLLAEHLDNGELGSRDAERMLFSFVNAGPAFIAVAVGRGVLNSQKIGYLLLLSHLSASIIIAVIISRLSRKKGIKYIKTVNITSGESSVDNFVLSVADAAQSIFKVCSFVIVFSVINSYLILISTKIAFVKFVIYLCEVTYSVSITKNAVLISFLLGFSGVCICCQILSILGKYGIRAGVLFLSRILHGLLSAAITFFLLKIFKLPIATLSNNLATQKISTVSGIHISISLIIMVLLLFITLFSKKHSGKRENNMV